MIRMMLWTSASVVKMPMMPWSLWSVNGGSKSIVQAANEQQVSELLNDGNGIGNSTCPKSFPDFVDLTFEFACDHLRRGFGAGKIGCALRRYLGPAETNCAMALPFGCLIMGLQMNGKNDK